MDGPLVTVGVPVYRGHEMVAATLECLRTQTYRNIDVLISVDGPDQASVSACQPFLSDPRFRLAVQPERLGWAANIGWTMRERRGAFYVYQQYDDQISPTYLADLVIASHKHPEASICFSKMDISGPRRVIFRDPPLLGDPLTRALSYLERLNSGMFRGLIRGSALDATAGMRTSEFNSFGSEFALMTELAIAGEFRFVKHPTYYKQVHGKNLQLQWSEWSEERRQAAWACLAAWMVEIIVPLGRTPKERWDHFRMVLERFSTTRGLLSTRVMRWARNQNVRLHSSQSGPRLAVLPTIIDRLRRNGRLDELMRARSRWMFCEIGHRSVAERRAFLRDIVERLKRSGKFDPSTALGVVWHELAERVGEFVPEGRRADQNGGNFAA